MARQEAAAIGGQQGNDRLIAFEIALEETFRLQRAEVEAVEEGPFALRRGALADQENGTPVLP